MTRILTALYLASLLATPFIVAGYYVREAARKVWKEAWW